MAVGFINYIKDILGNANRSKLGSLYAILGNPIIPMYNMLGAIDFYGKVTTFTDANNFKVLALAGLGNDFFNGYYVYVLRDAAGAGAAPQGELQPVTDYVSSDGTFTHTAFTVNLAVNDEILLVNPRFADLQYLVNKALSSPVADSIGEKVTNIETDTEKLYDAAFGVSPVDGSLASFIATGGTALGTRLPASKSLYDVIALDRLDHATYGLSVLNTYIWDKDISAYAGAGYAGTYLKTLYDDWLNGGRLDLIIDAILADTNELQTDWVNGGRLDLIIDAIKAETDKIAGATDIFHEQADTGFSIAVDNVGVDIFDFNAADTRYIIRDLRVKLGADPGANTVTISLETLINDVATVVDTFVIDTTNWGTYHSLMDMFGVPHIAGDDIHVFATYSVAGPITLTGQYSYGKTNV